MPKPCMRCCLTGSNSGWPDALASDRTFPFVTLGRPFGTCWRMWEARSRWRWYCSRIAN
jgi:hypothetical protein